MNLITDKDRKFTPTDLKKSSKTWNFARVTSSPYFPQADGEAERTIQIAKYILQRGDLFLAPFAHGEHSNFTNSTLICFCASTADNGAYTVV